MVNAQITLDAGAGWVRFRDESFAGDVFLRLEPDESGRWRVRDLVMRGTSRPLVAADVRELNLAGLEEFMQDAPAAFLEEEPLAHKRDDWAGLDDLTAMFPVESEPKPRVPRLQRPRHGLTDDFLRHVAAAYKQARADRKAPAPELARQVGDGATERTIHKWVYTARQRGIMPPAARTRKDK